MEKLLQYTILGLVTGGVYGIAASGLVLTYTTSGIFNFAHGALAMFGAFAYWQVRFGWGWPAPIALLAVLGIAAPLFGAVLHRVIMKGLRGTNEVVKIVVPISVMLGMVALATWIWNPGEGGRVAKKFFGSSNRVSIFGVNVTYHELVAVACAVLIAISLRYLFTRTRSGVAMRAVVDDPALLELNGGRPERLATQSWALGAFLAALAGVLIVPIQGGVMQAESLTLLVIDAFAAAMFGRLRSVPRTFVGAIVLGLLNAYVVGYFPGDWTWSSNFRQSLPMILLFIILLVLPQDRLRGAVVLRTRERFALPSIKTAVIAGVSLVVIMYLLRDLMHATTINTMAFSMCLALIALSLVLLTGYAGEINLAAMSFGAIGSLIVFHYGVTGSGADSRTTIWGYLLAAVVCAGVGALVALPALRLRGLYLALATMAFGVFVSRMVLQDINPRKLPILGWEFTIFPGGNIVVPRPEIGPIDLKEQSTFLMAVTILFAVLGVGLIAFRHSNYGRRLAAMKDSPAAAATLGMNVVKLKLLVFMLSAAIAGVGGALMTAQLGSANLERYIIFLSLSLLMLTVVGGIGYVSGALFAGILLGIGFQAIDGTFEKLASDQASFEDLFHFLADATTVMPAIIGIAMGRNPSGAVSDIVRDFRHVFTDVRLWGALVVLQGANYLAARNEVYSNWWFAIVLMLVMVLVARVGPVLLGQRAAREEQAEAEPPPVHDLLGLGGSFTIGDRDILDRELGLRGNGAKASVGAAASEGGLE